MGLKIRLSRGGAKKWPFYRIVVADTRSPRDGRFIERLGTYNPMVAKDSDDRIVLKEERINYWLSQGAKPSDRVARFLGQADIIKIPERNKQTKKHLPRTKTPERIKEREDAARALSEQASSEVSTGDLPSEELSGNVTNAEEGSAEEEKSATEETPPEEEKSAKEETPAEGNLTESGSSEGARVEIPAEESVSKK